MASMDVKLHPICMHSWFGFGVMHILWLLSCHQISSMVNFLGDPPKRTLLIKLSGLVPQVIPAFQCSTTSTIIMLRPWPSLDRESTRLQGTYTTCSYWSSLALHTVVEDTAECLQVHGDCSLRNKAAVCTERTLITKSCSGD